MKNKVRLLIIVLGCLMFSFSNLANAQVCESAIEKHAARVLGVDNAGMLTDQMYPFIAGENSFYQTLENGWVFALVRAENGWSIRLFEGEPVGNAVDLSSMTPPFRGAPNPRDIFGWHFRNADNTAGNEGSVNAPQALRAFIITPSLAGTGGYRPPTGQQAAQSPEPNKDDGIGWLKVLDYGLAGLEAGGRARMNYLKFDACLSWPRSEEDKTALADAASYSFTTIDHETFGSCGLDLERYGLTASYLPRMLGGDIDGDGAIDEVAQVQRKSDGKRGLALCRAGTWIDILGIDGGIVETGDVRTGYIGQVEAWQWLTSTSVLPADLAGYNFPDTVGDVLILERIEKEAVAIYWKNGGLRSHRLYHRVEP